MFADFLMPRKRSSESPVLRRSVFDPFADVWREMDRMLSLLPNGFDSFGNRIQERGELIPRLDINETASEIVVRAELPGMKEEDISLTLHDDELVMSGEKKQENEEVDSKGRHYTERIYGKVYRRIALPTKVNPDEIKAVFKDGVLSITLPKTEQLETERKIQIEHE